MRSTFRLFTLAAVATALGAAAELPAQDADKGPAFLRICNKGTRHVSVVFAFQDFSLLQYTLTVVGWVPIEPGACKRAYDVQGISRIPEPAWVAFAYFEQNGHFTPARVSSVPDLGIWSYYSGYAKVRYPAAKGPVLTAAAKTLCVHERPMEYELHTKSDVECASLHPGGDADAFQPIASQLFFHPVGNTCSRIGDDYICGGGHYYVDVAPRPGDPELRATRGTAPDVDERSKPRPVLDTAVKAALVDVLREAEKRGRTDAAAKAAENVRRDSAYAEYHRRDSLTWVSTWRAPHASVADFDPSWVGKTMVLRGTVSRIVEEPRSPTWVYIHFKESPDQTMIACSPSPNLLRSMFGENLDALVGKVLEIAGPVERYCGAKWSLRVVDRNQARIVQPSRP